MSNEDLWGAVPELDEQSRRALATAETWLGEDIQGVAIGRTDQGDRCVVVYTLDPTSAAVRSLPEEFEGLPVRVESGDAFRTEG